jgi:hypothetical protein
MRQETQRSWFISPRVASVKGYAAAGRRLPCLQSVRATTCIDYFSHAKGIQGIGVTITPRHLKQRLLPVRLRFYRPYLHQTRPAHDCQRL